MLARGLGARAVWGCGARVPVCVGSSGVCVVCWNGCGVSCSGRRWCGVCVGGVCDNG